MLGGGLINLSEESLELSPAPNEHLPPSTTGEEFVFNEIGNFHGQTLVENMPEGNYLLEVDFDGTWAIRFAE